VQTAPLVLSLACGDDSRRIAYDDQGSTCWGSSNGELTVRVSLPNCLSSSCDTDRAAQCTVLVEANRVLLDSHLAYTRQGDGDCTLDCGQLAADCVTALPADGTYTVDFGERTNVGTLVVVAGAIQSGSSPDCSGPF
jgi:hypothetical protein